MSCDTQKMPAIFYGHGNPMNALAENRYTETWAAIGISLPERPRAILCISAHWYIDGTKVTASRRPRVIHDFYGFPDELFAVKYPAPGAPEIAGEICVLLGLDREAMSLEWGLDHGAWSVLIHTFPAADIPVIQLSIDRSQPPEFHYEVGQRLAPLRERGILVCGSGNAVHNLGRIDFRPLAEPLDWAMHYEEFVKDCILNRHHGQLVNYESTPNGLLAAPTPEHFLPMLYVLGMQAEDEKASVLIDGIDAASIGMLTFKIGE